jgi:hypothetical protein
MGRVIACFLSLDTDRREMNASNNYVIACEFISAGTCLSSRCLAAIEEYRQQGNLISLLSFCQNIENIIELAVDDNVTAVIETHKP